MSDDSLKDARGQDLTRLKLRFGNGGGPTVDDRRLAEARTMAHRERQRLTRGARTEQMNLKHTKPMRKFIEALYLKAKEAQNNDKYSRTDFMEDVLFEYAARHELSPQLVNTPVGAAK